MLTMCVITGCILGWMSVEFITAISRGTVMFPILLNALMAFAGGVGSYMICTKLWGM